MESGNSVISLHSSSGAEDECHSRAAGQPPPFNHHKNDQTNNNINVNLLFLSHHLPNLDPPVRSKTLPLCSQQPVTATTANPKKRSRASRRAPTTVLTTDTSNFRAMVQEFTGIPSPPVPNLTTSLDLFGRPLAMMRSNPTNFDHLTQLPSYSPFIDHSCNLLNTMQNPLNQSPLLNPNLTTDCNKYFDSSNGFGAVGQAQIHQVHTVHTDHTTLADLISTAATPTTSGSRNDQLVASESSGVKDDQGFIEPWI
ncbi:hypothetical protein E3N88_04801 [Mikania micrantha]|uniref:VQ domain-containing protein n=1 Tax=Mikania micrantha TaxID=192012 RepID=A0A5N6PWD3_9ASTR|nr:hypothetical protein E3N88_04801 [Mikania micrantha]